jgi:hypothetical protein
MTLADRDRRALMLLAGAAVLMIIYWAASGDPAPAVVAPTSTESIAAAEQRLSQMRQAVARVPGKEAVLKQVAAELSEREKGLIVAETPAQATEQLLQIVRSTARASQMDLRAVELGQPKQFGDSYGEVTVSATTECRMEQLLNMMSDLTGRPELVATRDLRINAANPKEKTVVVRLTVAGIVPKRLAPQRKEAF